MSTTDIAAGSPAADSSGDDSSSLQVAHLSNEEITPDESSIRADHETGEKRPLVDGAEAISIREIQARPVRWLWPERITLGALTLLAGDPGLGKSLLTCHLAAELSSGKLGGAPAASLLLTAEDSLEATVRPRVEAAGGDLDLVKVVRMRRDGVPGGLSFPDDLTEFARLVTESDARLVVIDPFLAHLQETVNSHHDQAVRFALAPLYHLAEATGTAMLLVVHLNKAGEGDPLKRLGGSIGMPAAARSVLLLARDPDDLQGEQGPQRVLAQIKSNLGKPSPSLLYTVEPVTLAGGLETARLRHLGESRYVGSDLVVAMPAGRSSALAEAIQFLECQLADGPKLAEELFEIARSEAISEPTLKRAKKSVGAVSEKLGFDGGWAWALPASEPAPGAGAEPG
jgi:putative DNA primase/helicase